MLLLLGMAVGVGVLGVVAIVRHRRRHRWVSPYNDLAEAMRSVTRTEVHDFTASAGLVGLRRAPVVPSAAVIDLRHERAVRAGHPSVV